MPNGNKPTYLQEITLIWLFFSLNLSELMKVRKRLTVSLIVLAVVLFVIGAIANSIVVTKVIAAEDGFSDAYFLEPASEIKRIIKVTDPDSALKVILNATDKLQMYVEFDGNVEYSKNESQLQHNFVLKDPGEWKVIFRNNNPSRVDYSYSLVLTTFLKEEETPYAWLMFPAFLAGELALFLIMPITFYDSVRGKMNKKIAEILIFSTMLILALGFMPLFSLIAGTSTPLISPRSSSMEPTIFPGDLAIVTAEDPRGLKVGDILVYDELVKNLTIPNTEKISYPTMHRIVEVRKEYSKLFFVTKGDRNSDPDEWFVPEEGVIGKVSFVIPYLGTVVMILSQIEVKILIIIITIIILAIWPNKKNKTKVQTKNEEKSINPT